MSLALFAAAKRKTGFSVVADPKDVFVLEGMHEFSGQYLCWAVLYPLWAA